MQPKEMTRRLAVAVGLAGLALVGVLHYTNGDEPEAARPPSTTSPAPASKTSAPGPAVRDPSACLQCELANSLGPARKCNHTSSTANELTADPAKFGCDGFDGVEARLCHELLDCLRGPACAADIERAVVQQAKWGPISGYNENAERDDPTPCFCGDVPKIDHETQPGCVSMEAAQVTGACAKQYRAFEGVNVHTAFYSTDHAIGVANNLFTCDRDVPCPACLP